MILFSDISCYRSPVRGTARFSSARKSNRDSDEIACSYIYRCFILEVRNNKLLLLGGIAFVSELVWQLYKRFHELWTNTTNTCAISQDDVNEPKQNISEVMFFTRNSSLCRAHATSEKVCPKNNCPVRYMR